MQDPKVYCQWKNGKLNSVFSLVSALSTVSEEKDDGYPEAPYLWQQTLLVESSFYWLLIHSFILGQDDTSKLICAHGLLTPPSWERQRKSQMEKD